MAKYWEDWGDQTLGNEPAGWTKAWFQNGYSLTVQEDTDAPAGRRLRLNRTVSSDRTFITLDAVDNDPDRATLKIRALVKTEKWSTNALMIHGGVGGRITDAINEGAYVSAAYQASGANVGRLALNRYASSSTLLYESGNDVLQPDTYYWIGLDCIGDQITVSVRDKDDPNIVLHTSTITDSVVSNAGRVGVFAFSSVSGNVDFGAVAIATGSDEAFYANPTHQDPPQGTVTISNISPGITTASVSYSYNNTDQNGFQYRINDGAPISIGSSPATITGLTEDTTYNSPGLQIRAVNAVGNGAWSTATAFSTNPAAAAVKGIRVTLHDSDRQPLSSITNVTARWYDSATGAGAPELHTNSASINSSGMLELNIDSSTSLNVGGVGYLQLYKAGASPNDDLHFGGRVSVVDISQ